jgi:hypothetical protein
LHFFQAACRKSVSHRGSSRLEVKASKPSWVKLSEVVVSIIEQLNRVSKSIRWDSVLAADVRASFATRQTLRENEFGPLAD